MMESFMKVYLPGILVALAGIGAWFKLQSDHRSHGERITRLETEAEQMKINAERIQELQVANATANEHRNTMAILMAKMDERMARQEDKLDDIQQSLHHMDATLEFLRQNRAEK